MTRRQQGEAKIRTSTKTLAKTPQRTNYIINRELNLNLRKAAAKYQRLLTDPDTPVEKIKMARGLMRGCALAVHVAQNAPYDAEGWTLADIERRALEEINESN